MRIPKSFRPVFLCAFVVAACSVADDTETSPEESGLVQFPATAFANAPLLTYGNTTQPIAYTQATGWRVVRWNGAAGDELVATIAPTTADRVARAYLVEQRGSQYVAILSGTQSIDGVVKAKLEKTQEYFIAFREYRRRNASFTVSLAKTAGLPTGCTGTPLLAQGVIDRTPQAAEPGLELSGTFQSSIRFCNAGSGCADPVTVKALTHDRLTSEYNGDGRVELLGGVSGNSWSLEHNATTGELAGKASVDTGGGYRKVSVDIKGAATTGCISFAGGTRVEVDALTYYDVSVTFTGSTPPVAPPRIAYPATPPPAECEGQPVIADEEVLARFPPSTSSVELGKSTSFVIDSQSCHPQTGCTPWRREVGVKYLDAWTMSVSAYLVSTSSLGIKLSGSYWGANNYGRYESLKLEESAELQDGFFTPAGSRDVLYGGADMAQTGSISDTHVFVRDVKLWTTTSSYSSLISTSRRYACVPIIAHP